MARVIRGSGSVLSGEVVDARQEAERIVKEAEAEAARMVEEARDAADALSREATALGRAEAEAETASLLVGAAAVRDAALASAETEVARLALAAAEHIVGQELAVAPDIAIDIVRDVLSRARRAQTVSIRVHPDDEGRLASAIAGVEIIADPAIGRGGCIVKTNLGQLDARLEVRLEALKQKLGL